MTTFNDLPAGDRAEIDAAIVAAYEADDGSTRTHAEAREIFDKFVASAVQAHRTWAGILLDWWRVEGETRFLRDRLKAPTFALLHNGRKRKRSVHRGTQVRDDTGKATWVQPSLLTFDAEQLKNAISQSVRRIEEERANIHMYRALLDLLEETGAALVGDALGQRGQSLEEFLADRAA